MRRLIAPRRPRTRQRMAIEVPNDMLLVQRTSLATKCRTFDKCRNILQERVTRSNVCCAIALLLCHTRLDAYWL
jgi:hypothetical protein